jgi:hypothetical protein
LPLQYEFPTLEAVRELRIAVVKSTMKQILRWLAVLPGALLAGVIVTFPVHWAALYIHDFGAGEPIITNEEGKGLLQSLPLESLERFGDALFVSGTIVAIGAHIAPRFHFATAIVLTLLLIAFLAFAVTQVRIDDSRFRLVITCVLNVVSITVAIFHAHDLDTRE